MRAGGERIKPSGRAGIQGTAEASSEGNDLLQGASIFIELSHEQGFISTNSCEYWSKLALDVKYMLAAWKSGIVREGEPFGVHLVTPNSSNAQNVRNVNSDGTLNNNNAYNGNRGVRPLRWKMRSSRRKPKAEYHHQRKVYPAAAIHSGGKYRIADARAFRAAEGKGYKQRGYFL